jgi:hypothetical protein
MYAEKAPRPVHAQFSPPTWPKKIFLENVWILCAFYGAYRYYSLLHIDEQHTLAFISLSGFYALRNSSKSEVDVEYQCMKKLPTCRLQSRGSLRSAAQFSVLKTPSVPGISVKR